MIRVTKAGGRVVVLDTDWGTLSIDTPDIDVERRLVRVLAERVLHNGYSGRQLYRLFRNSGLGELSVDVLPVHLTSYSLIRQVTLMDRVEQEALATGVVTHEQMAAWHTHLERLDAADSCFASGALVLMTGRKS